MSSMQRLAAVPATDADNWSAAPFDPALGHVTRQLIAKLTPAQRLWLSGYLAGSLDRPASVVAIAPTASPVVVLYGSQSGNCERVAAHACAALAARGIPHVSI